METYMETYRGDIRGDIRGDLPWDVPVHSTQFPLLRSLKTISKPPHHDDEAMLRHNTSHRLMPTAPSLQQALL